MARPSLRPRPRRAWQSDDGDPAAGLVNLFDVWLVFAVSLLLALLAAYRLPELVSSQDEVTVVKNPGTPDMQIIRKKGTEIETLKPSGSKSTGEGQKLGTAYKLKSGKVVYVPEGGP